MMASLTRFSSLQRTLVRNTISKYGDVMSKYGEVSCKYGEPTQYGGATSKYGRMCSVHTCSALQNQVYEETFRRSVQSPEEFWEEKAQEITWFKKYDQVLDYSNPPHSKWFVGGEMNTCYEAIDVHVEKGFGNEVGLIYDSPVTGRKQHITYSDLQHQVSRFARVLVDQGVHKGDRVVIYMPMIPEAIVAIYACARIGAIHCVVFGGFASNELARRIDDSKAKLLVTASCGIEPGKVIQYDTLVEDAIAMSTHKPLKVITVDREESPKQKFNSAVDLIWDDVMTTDVSPHDCVPIDANDPLYILYTSGTTGTPKGIVRPCGGHAVALKWSMKGLYDINPGDRWWAASDIGWIVGHSYIVYAPFFTRTTSILFEGKPVGSPDASTFFRVIDQHGVKGLFTAPTAIRVIKNEDPAGKFADQYEMKKLESLFLAGEHADSQLLKWANTTFRVPVIDHWWQTESGWPITTHPLQEKLPQDYHIHSIGKPSPGWNVQILDKDQKECQAGTLGEIYVKLPLPPGAMSTIWDNHDAFLSKYFTKVPGYYDSCDAGMMDEEGFVFIGGRLDDVINVAGHRLSTKQMELAMAKHPDVMEQAVIGIDDEVKGVQPIGLVVLNKGSTKSSVDVEKELIQLVRTDIGPVAAFKKVICLPYLPKTRSTKIVRGVLTKILNGDEYTVPLTVENVDHFHAVEEILLKERHLLNR